MQTCSQIEKSGLAQLQESINALTQAFTDFKGFQDQRNDSYLTTFNNIQTQLQETRTITHTPQPHTIDTIKPPKLILQQFDGSNPLEWIFQADQFFTHYNIPPAQRLSHIPCYMLEMPWDGSNGCTTTTW